MIVKLGNAYINLCIVPIVEFDFDDKDRERVIFWLPQGPITYIRGEEIPDEEFAKLKETLENLRKGIALC